MARQWHRLPGLLSPTIVLTLLIACLFLLRLPIARMPFEFNVDESQLLAEAMKFAADPRPWNSVDTCGPLNSWIITVFLLLGFKLGYVLAHMLASVLVCLQVLVAYLTLRRLKSDADAGVGALLMVLLYGLSTKLDLLHYSTELLPTLLAMVGFYLFIVWLHEISERRRIGIQLGCLYLGGLALGSAPWGKLQALPITGALGILFLTAVFYAPRGRTGLKQKAVESVVFLCGGLSTTGAILGVSAAFGSLPDFWYSYIRAPLNFVGSLSLITCFVNLLRLLLMSPIHQLLLVAILGIALLDGAVPNVSVRRLLKGNAWAYGGVAAYAGAALFTATRSSYGWLHHGTFLVPPMTYIAALLIHGGASKFVEARAANSSMKRPIPSLLGPGLLALLVLGVYSAYAIRYVQLISTVGQNSGARSEMHLDSLRHPDPNSNKVAAAAHRVWEFLRLCIGPERWGPVEDGSQPIAAVVRDIEKQRPVNSISVWGWDPGIYVLTGIPPSTRDTITERAIDHDVLQEYFDTRYVNDLRANPPDLFIDAITKGGFMWLTWSESDGYESNAQLREFIDENYVLVRELTLAEGTKPIRFFARRAEPSRHEQ